MGRRYRVHLSQLLQTIKKVLSSRHVRMDRTLRRVRGSAPNFVPRDCEAEARPADETAEAEQGPRSAFRKRPPWRAAKTGNRNHQGEGISAPRLRAEMGSPWSVSFFDTLPIPDNLLLTFPRPQGALTEAELLGRCLAGVWECRGKMSSQLLIPAGAVLRAAGRWGLVQRAS